MSKLFEKLIHHRLNPLIENILPPEQYGFRKSHSTSHQLLRITEIIERGFEAKKFTSVLFIDFAQAFDKVWINGLIYKILKLELPSYLTSCLISFLQNRTFSTRINCSYSQNKRICSGVPQGSILGPILFNIFMHDIPTPNETELALYADDTAIVTQNEDLATAVNRLQASTNYISQWCKKW